MDDAAGIPLGPIQDPPYQAIPHEPGQSGPANEEALRDALSGLPLGGHDERIIAWLTMWETTTVATICSWLYRVRALDYEGPEVTS